jgi:hypothetical protein
MTPPTPEIDTQRLSANYRPGHRIRYRKSVDHTIRHGIGSMLRSVVRREDFDVPDLAALAALRSELDDAIEVAARRLHDDGYSWTVIGDQLGTTRQNAFQRFGRSRRTQRRVDI